MVNFQVLAIALIPIPGTPQWNTVHDSGLLRSTDPSIFGGMWTSAVDTRYLSYKQIAEWQVRLAQIGAPYMGL